MDDSWRLDRQGWHDRGGALVPRRWLTGVSRYRRSGPPNSTRFSPTTLWRHRELDSLTLGRKRTTVAAGNSEAVWLASGVDAGKLRCSSGEDEGTKGGDGLRRSFRDGQFGTSDSTLARRRASHNGSGFDYCGSKFAIERALYIELFGLNRRWQRF
jgi:hypothetical protein